MQFYLVILVMYFWEFLYSYRNNARNTIIFVIYIFKEDLIQSVKRPKNQILNILPVFFISHLSLLHKKANKITVWMVLLTVQWYFWLTITQKLKCKKSLKHRKKSLRSFKPKSVGYQRFRYPSAAQLKFKLFRRTQIWIHLRFSLFKSMANRSEGNF